MAVQFAFQLRVDHGDGGGAAGGGRDQRHARGPRPAQVFVWGIDHNLRIGGVMNGGDDTVFDTDLFVQHLDHRGQAVGGAAGGG